MTDHIAAAAHRLVEARAGGPTISSEFIAAHPLSMAEALQVRERVQAGTGAIGAWKIAPDSTPENPGFAAIFLQDVYSSPASIAHGRFRSPGIECEIAYVLRRALMRPPYTREQVMDAIDYLVPLMEITDTRLADKAAAPASWQQADQAANGAIVVGPRFSEWQAFNPQRQAARLTFNGAVAGEADRHPRSDLIAIVGLLANQAGQHCGGPHAGHVITTGSMFGSIPVARGTEVVATFPGMAELQVTLE